MYLSNPASNQNEKTESSKIPWSNMLLITLSGSSIAQSPKIPSAIAVRGSPNIWVASPKIWSVTQAPAIYKIRNIISLSSGLTTISVQTFLNSYFLTYANSVLTQNSRRIHTISIYNFKRFTLGFVSIWFRAIILVKRSYKRKTILGKHECKWEISIWLAKNVGKYHVWLWSSQVKILDLSRVTEGHEW